MCNQQPQAAGEKLALHSYSYSYSYKILVESSIEKEIYI